MAKKFSIFSILLICLAGFLAYANSLNGIFVFDDHSFIENNPAIYNLFNFNEITKFHPSRPFGTYTFALDYFFWGLNPFGYHLTNLLIHLMTSVLVWWLVTMFTPGWVAPGWVALTAALIFAVHPIHTEAVNYITQRYTSLAGLLYLTAVCCYVRARLSNNNWKFFAVSLFAALLGAWTREILITLPIVLWMTEYFFLQQKGVSKIPVKYFLFLIAVLAVIPIAHSFNVFSIWGDKGPSHSHEAEQITTGNYFLTQFRVLAVYLGLLVLPLQQNFEYDFAVSKSFFEPAVMLSFLFLATLIVLAWLLRRKKPLISFGIFWFFVTILIEGGLIPIPYVINEYRTYLPSVGYCIVVSALLFTPGVGKLGARLAVAAVALVIGGYSYLTFERNKIWQDEIVFWQDVVKKSPNKSRPYDNLAQAYLAAGNSEKAVENLRKALTINTHNATTYTNLGVAYLGMGKNEEALRQFDVALQLIPDFGWAWNNHGVALLNIGKEVQAQRSFEEALKAKEMFLEPRLNLAGIYRRQENPAKAAQLYRQAVELYPHDGNGYVELLKISLEQNDLDEAASIIARMVQSVDDPTFLTAAGSVAASHNLSELAYKLFAKAIKGSPQVKSTYIELGKFYANDNRFDAAVQIWEDGLKKFNDDEFKSLISQAREIEKNLSP